MKNILLSVRPKWCEKICHEIYKDSNGKPIYEKVIEVRKSKPDEVPFRVFIYETKAITETPWVDEDGHLIFKGRGKVIGEFICNKVEAFTVGSLRCDDIQELACLSYKEMINYYYKPEELDGKTSKIGYGWHISDLKIYDKPRELSEFRKPCPYGDMPCGVCEDYSVYSGECRNIVTHPPQSWCYVEEEK